MPMTTSTHESGATHRRGRRSGGALALLLAVFASIAIAACGSGGDGGGATDGTNGGGLQTEGPGLETEMAPEATG